MRRQHAPPFWFGVALVAGLMAVGGLAHAQTAPEAVSSAAASSAAVAAPAVPEPSESLATLLQSNADILWTCIAAFLVFFMQAGFALVEAGFTRAKNCCNIIMKNLMDFSIGSLGFFVLGFAIMFGMNGGALGDFLGLAHVDVTDLTGLSEGTEHTNAWSLTFWLFQTVFAATAATIVSGAMAERTKFSGYLAYSVFITVLIYPIFGSFAWGSLYGEAGFLEKMGFIDFAGSTVVHSIGGWCALAGAIVLGARSGKYGPNGQVKALPGHNIPLAALGIFILWFGWFGFNPGSETAVDETLGYIAVTTNLAAAAGAMGAMILSWLRFKKPDPSMSLNGVLAGLVAITAGCANVTPLAAVFIGLFAGGPCVPSPAFIDKVLKIDDPVGAVSVHGVCGAWGTLAAGLFDVAGFSLKTVGVQLFGIGLGFVWAFGLALLLFYIIKVTIGLRVSRDEELRGLDIGEHGMEAYAGFQVFSTE